MVLISVAIVGCGGSQPDVSVFAAASVAEAVEELAAAFEADTGHTVSVNGAATSVLAQQIDAGASADLFFSANAEWADFLESRELVSTRLELLENRLVLAVPMDSAWVSSPEDLLDVSVSRVAVADTDSVPAGRYAKQALEKLGLWSDLESKLLPAANVRQALLYVEQEEADAALVYATDVLMSENARAVFEFAVDLTGAIEYPLVLTRQGARSDRAREFYAFMQSPEARAVFEQRGFRWVSL